MGVPKTFTGQLKQNSVLSTLFNMIISQEVIADNINMKGTLVDKFRIDGTLYGDTKLYINTDVGTIANFPNDKDNLLTKVKMVQPDVQEVKVDQFRQTAITIDSVQLKQAFMNAEMYSAFSGVVVEWLRDAFKVFNTTLINTVVGTTVSKAIKGLVDVPLPAKPAGANATITELRQWESYQAELIGASIADIAVDLEDVSRDFNDIKFLRSCSLKDFFLVWNKKYANKIKHISLPKIFNKDDVIGKELESITINDRYFGDILATAGSADGTSVRTLVDVVVAGKQYFPGDILPSGTAYLAGEAYKTNDKIICKLISKRAIPFMSAMQVSTEFYNAKDLDRTYFLTWGYSTPTYLRGLPLITFKATA